MEKQDTQPKAKTQNQPGVEGKMEPKPIAKNPDYKGSGKLAGKVALITGGDSGIGRAVAILFAQEGADVVINCLEEQEDAEQTKRDVAAEGRQCHIVFGDISDPEFCRKLLEKTLDCFRRLDILVNNAAKQCVKGKLEEISDEQLKDVFATNILSMFYLTKAALAHIPDGSNIINTTSVNAYKGNAHNIDYAATKGAIVSFTRSLALSLVDKNIRVNAVAPGPVWTPLIPAGCLPPEEIAQFGKDVPMNRMAHPYEIAPCYLFLATADSVYMTGQVLHPNGGVIVNG